MRAIERDGSDIGLHTFGEGADLIIESHRARAAQGCGEESMLRGNRSTSPRVSKGVAAVDALPNGRATAPIQARACANARAKTLIETREQSRESCFFKNVAGVVTGDRIATQPDVDAMREKLLKRCAPVTELGV